MHVRVFFVCFLFLLAHGFQLFPHFICHIHSRIDVYEWSRSRLFSELTDLGNPCEGS